MFFSFILSPVCEFMQMMSLLNWGGLQALLDVVHLSQDCGFWDGGAGVCVPPEEGKFSRDAHVAPCMRCTQCNLLTCSQVSDAQCGQCLLCKTWPQHVLSVVCVWGGGSSMQVLWTQKRQWAGGAILCALLKAGYCPHRVGIFVVQASYTVKGRIHW